MIELVLFGVFAVLLILGVPVAFSLGLAAASAMLYIGYFVDLSVVPSVMFASLSSETLLAIPFFILAGAIMEFAGISKRLVDFADACVGHRKHGLAMVVIIAAFFFSAISGSGPATVAAVGTILIPALIRHGYAKRHATSLMASAGSMGIVVPPSIAFIIFAVVASDYQRVSIARLFIAGIVPGILLATALLIACYFIPRQPVAAMAGTTPSVGGSRSERTATTPDPSGGSCGDEFVGTEELRHLPEAGQIREHIGRRVPGQVLRRSLLSAIPGLLVPVIILGGIYGGIFTPTESAVVAAVYALIVGLGFYREIKVSTLPKVFITAAVQSSVVMLIVGAASVFAYVITANRVANTVADALLSISESKAVILLVVMVLLLVVGMFMDAVSAIYVFVPILLPVLLEVGVDITTIGVFMVVNLAVGLVTPPVGVNLFVAAGIADAPLSEVVKGLWPFLTASLAALLLITYIPALSNWLPDLLGV